jgi:tight adherence protein B
MNDEVQLIGVLAGLAVLAFSAGFAARVERRRLEERLQAFVGAGPILGRGQGPTATGPRVLEDTRHPILRATKLGVQARQLAQGGWSMSPTRFLLIQLTSGLLGFAIARLFGQRFGWENLEFLLLEAAGLLIGLGLPRFVLWLAISRRSSRIEKQLPMALDSIANGIQAGLSLPQSFEVVSRDMPLPLGAELRIVIRELGLGLGIEEALGNLADRVPLKEIEIFVAAIHIQFRTGGNLSDILRTLAHTIRERLRIRGDVDSLTAQAKLSSYIVSALPFIIALAIRVINPVYFEKLLEPGSMRLMVIGAIVSMAFGFYILMRIAKIEI